MSQHLRLSALTAVALFGLTPLAEAMSLNGQYTMGPRTGRVTVVVGSSAGPQQYRARITIDGQTANGQLALSATNTTIVAPGLRMNLGPYRGGALSGTMTVGSKIGVVKLGTGKSSSSAKSTDETKSSGSKSSSADDGGSSTGGTVKHNSSTTNSPTSSSSSSSSGSSKDDSSTDTNSSSSSTSDSAHDHEDDDGDDHAEHSENHTEHDDHDD